LLTGQHLLKRFVALGVGLHMGVKARKRQMSLLMYCAFFLDEIRNRVDGGAMFTVGNSSHQPSAFMRGLSLCLASLIFLLGMASVSPEMHEALHASSEHSHSCEGHHDDAPLENDGSHSCAVTLFDQGATGVGLLVELPARTDSILAVFSLSAEVIYCGQAPIRRCSRAPPIETVV
jgi:hypothetical protein